MLRVGAISPEYNGSSDERSQHRHQAEPTMSSIRRRLFTTEHDTTDGDETEKANQALYNDSEPMKSKYNFDFIGEQALVGRYVWEEIQATDVAPFYFNVFIPSCGTNKTPSGYNNYNPNRSQSQCAPKTAPPLKRPASAPPKFLEVKVRRISPKEIPTSEPSGILSAKLSS